MDAQFLRFSDPLEIFFCFCQPHCSSSILEDFLIFLAKGTRKVAKQEARKNFFWQSCLTFQNFHAVVKNCIKKYCAGLVCWGLCLVDQKFYLLMLRFYFVFIFFCKANSNTTEFVFSPLLPFSQEIMIITNS